MVEDTRTVEKDVRREEVDVDERTTASWKGQGFHRTGPPSSTSRTCLAAVDDGVWRI
jgi:hypothetical protein